MRVPAAWQHFLPCHVTYGLRRRAGCGEAGAAPWGSPEVGLIPAGRGRPAARRHGCGGSAPHYPGPGSPARAVVPRPGRLRCAPRHVPPHPRKQAPGCRRPPLSFANYDGAQSGFRTYESVGRRAASNAHLAHASRLSVVTGQGVTRQGVARQGVRCRGAGGGGGGAGEGAHPGRLRGCGAHPLCGRRRRPEVRPGCSGGRAAGLRHSPADPRRRRRGEGLPASHGSSPPACLLAVSGRQRYGL